jgi:hypothetical protein
MPVRLPKWSNEQAVLDLITHWWTHSVQVLRPVVRARPLDLRDVSRTWRNGREISQLDRADFAELLDDLLDRAERRKGRPKKLMTERRAASMLPQAEGVCFSAKVFLKRNYANVKDGDIHERAIAWTAARFKMKKKTLRYYMVLPEDDRRRLSPKPRLR